MQTVAFAKNKDGDKYATEKEYHKVKDYFHFTGKYRGVAHVICNLKYSIPKKYPVVVHNGSNYDYHFIIKELVKEFEGEFNCLGENTKKCKTFSVPITKEVKSIDKNGKEITKAISYRLQSNNIARFIASPSSNLVDNLAAGNS